ncbi:MAG: hypothetical protein LH632_07435 [Rhodoferax sp.]|nr:hypothetical protein [Rhodoferax sp.]
MNRIPVTGASGTIGNPLVKRLGEIGADCAIMSSRPGVGILGDFNDPASLERAFGGVDTLFLLFPFAPDMLALARNAVAGARGGSTAHRSLLWRWGRSGPPGVDRPRAR